MPEDRSELDLDFAVAHLVRHDLRHDDPRIGEARQSLIRSVCKLARLADHDTAAREEAQKISAQFVTFQRPHAWLHREFEQAAAGAAKLRVLEQVATEAEMAGLREALAAAERRVQESEASPTGLQVSRRCHDNGRGPKWGEDKPNLILLRRHPATAPSLRLGRSAAWTGR